MAELTIRGNNHPQFEGPIGSPKAGRQSRMSYVGVDGKRHWHTRAMTAIGASSQHVASLTGQPLASVMGAP